MGKPVALLGCIHTGHGCWSPTNNIVASTNVIINGKGAVRVGDMYVPHTCKDDTHVPVQSSGSSTVMVNGKPLARFGDSTACGAKVMSGISSNVIVGG